MDRTLPRVRGLILCTPYVVEADRGDPMRRCMDDYGSVMRHIAAEQQLPLVDTQAAIDRLVRHRHATELAWDRINDGPVVYMALAQAWLRSTGQYVAA
ncbi:MAG: hypothetical protein ACOCXJ_02195 [Planctomycetota bacterium]